VSFKATIERLRAMGVPDAAIPSVMEMIDAEREEARRPRTGTERSRACREKKRNENATKTLQDRSENVAPALQNRCADVAPEAPLACAFFMGEEVSILPPEKPTVSTPKGEKQKSEGRNRGSRLPQDWRPNDEGRKLAVEILGSNAAAHAELAKFSDYWQSKAGAKALHANWDSAWRYWLRNGADRHVRGPPNGNSHNQKPTIFDAARARLEKRNERPDDDLPAGESGGIRRNPLRLLSSN